MRADPAVTFIVVVVVGLVAGILFDRLLGPSWLSRQFTGARSMITSALVGIAGAFLGYHIALLVTSIALSGALVAAVIGAAVVLFGWRAAR